MIPSLVYFQALPRFVMNKAPTVATVSGLVVVLAAACGGAGPAAGPATTGTVRVVTTTAILADFVRNVGGERVDVSSIVPPGADVHSFQTTPGDSVLISKAAVIVSNGKGLDSFLAPLLEGAANEGAQRVIAARELETVPILAMALPPVPGAHEAGEQDHEDSDPHLWQNPLFAVSYVERILAGLVAADPAGAGVYQGNATAYIQTLRDLDREIGQLLDAVPEDRRRLVTFHDAFGYFGARYGWEVSAFVAGDGADVTPGAVVAVLESIKAEGIPAVFAEPQFGGDVLTEAARDAGVKVGIIYSDALESGLGGYVEMMRHNARSLGELLGDPG
jgi:ABC-type Zn uptake system ZnuABC Zn-binding protein ZnuA